MNVHDLFVRISAAWPTNIDISNRKQSPDGKHWCPALAEEHHKVEDAIDHTVDHWGNVGAWSFYQAIFEHANTAYSRGERIVEVRSVPLELFNQKVIRNLASPGFEKERSSYEEL